jgi:hypothetical protein
VDMSSVDAAFRASARVLAAVDRSHLPQTRTMGVTLCGVVYLKFMLISPEVLPPLPQTSDGINAMTACPRALQQADTELTTRAHTNQPSSRITSDHTTK